MDYCLFDSIDTFLSGCRQEAHIASCRGYWREHAITRADVALLRALDRSRRCPAEIAATLGRCPVQTREVLDALASIGLVEARDGLYAATDVTILYCRRLEQG